MTSNSSDMTLFRIDPSKNMQRFYSTSIQPNLFGGHSLIRSWGRIGTGGQMRIDLFEDEQCALASSRELLAIKLRRGYQLNG